MQIYGSLSEEKKRALDVLMAQADGDLISRTELLKALETWDRFGVDDTNSLFRLDNLSLPHYVAYIHYDDVVKCIKGMPSVKPQEPKLEQFAKWVATEIFDEWEYNKDSFAEIACRKLEKLGIVRAKGDEWELIEPTCDTCEYTTAAFNPCNACKDKSEYKPQERSE